MTLRYRLFFSASFAHTPPEKTSSDLIAYARHQLATKASDRLPVRNDGVESAPHAPREVEEKAMSLHCFTLGHYPDDRFSSEPVRQFPHPVVQSGEERTHLVRQAHARRVGRYWSMTLVAAIIMRLVGSPAKVYRFVYPT